MAVNISRDNAFEGYTIFNHNLVYKGYQCYIGGCLHINGKIKIYGNGIAVSRDLSNMLQGALYTDSISSIDRICLVKAYGITKGYVDGYDPVTVSDIQLIKEIDWQALINNNQ